MFEIDRISKTVRDAIEKEDIRISECLLAAFCDRDQNQKVGEVYLLCSGDTLSVVSGTSAEGNWKIRSVERYAFDALGSLSLEEQRSTGRLLSKKDGQTKLIAAFTNFCKESMLLFVKYANQLIKDGKLEIDEKDRSEEKRCPKCGMRYPDPARKLCPHCMEKGKLFRRMMIFFGAYKGRLILMLLSLVLLTAMSILTPYLSGSFFYDEVLFETGKFYGEILLVIGLIIATKLLNMLANMVNNWVSSVVAARMVFDLKKTIFASIQRLSLSFFTGRQTGGLMTQVNDDANTIYSFFCDILPHLIINIVKVAVLTVLLLIINPLLAAIALITVPVYFLMIQGIFRTQKKLHARRFTGARQLNSFLGDVLSGMRVVKAFSREQDEINRFSVRNEALAKSDRELSVYHNYTGHFTGILLYLGNIIAWGVGGWMVIRGYGDFSYGALMTFIAYINMIYSPLEFFASMTNRTADCTNAMQRLFEIMDAEPEVRERENAIVPENLGGSVDFRHVSFSYVKGKRVIEDVSFFVPEGGILGIVGHTGAGKSTLANLLMRLYEVEEGEILIGGYPVKDLALSSLYDHIAIVSQETYLFMGTILENIRYAKPNATYDEVIEAAKCAGAHDFIMQLPDAYHTRIGFGFHDLSGGERQRISIARAILKNPKILILDEATAAMDTGTERRIQEALSQLIVGKTTIMIAHRLSTLRDADRLIVIEHGRVAEEGTHAELLEKEDGIYKKLFTLQTEALKSAGIVE